VFILLKLISAGGLDYFKGRLFKQYIASRKRLPFFILIYRIKIRMVAYFVGKWCTLPLVAECWWQKAKGSIIKYSFLFGLILEKLDIKEKGEILNGNYHYNFALGIFLLSLICLLNLINVIAYLIVSSLFNINNVESKYPKFKNIIKYFHNTSLYFVIFEGIICLLFLLAIVIFSLLEIYLR